VGEKQKNQFHPIISPYTLAVNVGENIAVIAVMEAEQFVLNVDQRIILTMIKYIQNRYHGANLY